MGSRGDPGVSDATTSVRGVRQGSVTIRELRGLDAVNRRNGTWRGIAFVAVLMVTIIGGLVVFVGPPFREFAWDLARDNPLAIRIPFVSDAVRDRLGSALTDPAGTSDAPRPFVVASGQSVKQIGANLMKQGFVNESLAFQYLAVTQGLDGMIMAGSYSLRETMTPQEVVTRLAAAPDPKKTKVLISLRPALRLEQIAAKLLTLRLQMDVAEFYDIVRHPPESVREDYPFLKTLPKGRSLEGYMGAGNFTVDFDIAAETLVRLLLDDWQRDIGPSVAQAARKGLDFYRVLTIASIVERETAVDAERAKIAGVYTNRLDPKLNATLLMNADPTVVYAVDMDKLRARAFETWPTYKFWTDHRLSRVAVSADLSSYQTYKNPGLPDGPIATPTLPSINAAMAPDTKQGYLYFYACPDKDTHLFAKTLSQQQSNIASCN